MTAGGCPPEASSRTFTHHEPLQLYARETAPGNHSHTHTHTHMYTQYYIVPIHLLLLHLEIGYGPCDSLLTPTTY